MPYHKYYLDHLYPLQDKFLAFFDKHNQNRFYLTGGTAFKQESLTIEIETISDHFFRVYAKEKETSLKIDFVNEAVFHWGQLNHFPIFPYVDNEMNILSNKITCVSRYEVKDMADIWVLAKHLSFSWREVIDIANKKSPVDPVEVSKIIKTLPREELKIIKWALDVNIAEVYSDLQTIAEDILLGRTNTLKSRVK